MRPRPNPTGPPGEPETEPTALDLDDAGIKSVVWGTGFRSDWSWIDIPAFTGQLYPEHDRGITTVPGLSFVGLPWLQYLGLGPLFWHRRGCRTRGRRHRDQNHPGRVRALSRDPTTRVIPAAGKSSPILLLSGAGLRLRRAKPVGEAGGRSPLEKPAESGPQGRVEARRASSEGCGASFDTAAFRSRLWMRRV